MVAGDEQSELPPIRAVVFQLRHVAQVTDANGFEVLPEAFLLLERLKYWSIHIAVLVPNSFKDAKVEDMKVVVIQGDGRDCLEKAVSQVVADWSIPRGATLVLVDNLTPLEGNWRTLCLRKGQDGPPVDQQTSSAAAIEQLAQVPRAISMMNKMAGKGTAIGYSMRHDREISFLKRGIFTLVPRHNQTYSPLDLDQPLGPQLEGADVLLHRAMDELQAVEWVGPEDCSQGPVYQVISSSEGVTGDYVGSAPAWVYEGQEWRQQLTYSTGQEDLDRAAGQVPGLCILDPFDKVALLVDRPATYLALADLQTCSAGSEGLRIRLPHTVMVGTLELSTVEPAMEAAGMKLPCIVKPRVACSVKGAHSMAVVLKPEGFAQLMKHISLPAMLQEYIDHDSVQHKCYALGSQIFTHSRMSTPNAADLALKEGNLAEAPAAVIFDSLRSPLKGAPSRKYSRRNSRPAGTSSGPQPSHIARPDFAAESTGEHPESSLEDLHLEELRPTVEWLKERLGLHLFGFDLLEQEETGDFVLVDVNYFPSFKDIPDEEAAPAVWGAVQEAYLEHSNKS